MIKNNYCIVLATCICIGAPNTGRANDVGARLENAKETRQSVEKMKKGDEEGLKARSTKKTDRGNSYKNASADYEKRQETQRVLDPCNLKKLPECE